jgi:murein DD-endopeptidase MepM/ murein hydrolase activator NlpD
MNPVELSASDALSTSLEILDKLGILEKVYLKLVNNPTKAADELNKILGYLESAFKQIQTSVAQMCTLSFAPDDLASTRRVLIEKDNGLSQELRQVSIHCVDISRIYYSYLDAIIPALLNKTESKKIKALFDDLTNADGHFRNAVDVLDHQLKSFAHQALTHLDQKELKKAESLTRQLFQDLKPARRVLEDKLSELSRLQLQFVDKEVDNPCAKPTKWPVAPSPTVTPLKAMEWATGGDKDKFGCTRDAGKKFHAGIDIKAPVGTPCYATEDAKVEEVGFGTDLGTYVSISFKKGTQTYGVAYCHLSKTSVKKNDTIKAGAKIGETGITGNAEPANPHLHLEVQNQVWVAYANAADRSVHGVNPNGYIS